MSDRQRRDSGIENLLSRKVFRYASAAGATGSRALCQYLGSSLPDDLSGTTALTPAMVGQNIGSATRS
jgi:hypothetical protein